MNKSWSTAPGTIKGYAGLAALSFLISLFSALYGVATDDLDTGAAGLSAGATDIVKSIVAILVIGFLAVIAAIYAWLIFKLSNGRKWAWIVLVVLDSIGLLFGIIALFSGNFIDLTTTILGAVSMALLLMPDTRDYVEDNRSQLNPNGYVVHQYAADAPPGGWPSATYNDRRPPSENW